jgi:hypothetical protein
VTGTPSTTPSPAYGEALLAADRKRLSVTSAIGLDETSFVRLGSRLARTFATTVADVHDHQIVEILPTRNFEDVARWVRDQPEAWRSRITYGALDMSSAYSAVYSVALPKVTQVVDPFHLVRWANKSLDDVRRRVQSEQLGHRGRRDDPSTERDGCCCAGGTTQRGGRATAQHPVGPRGSDGRSRPRLPGQRARPGLLSRK